MSVIVVAAAIVAIRVIQFSREFNRKVVSIPDEQVKLMLNSELPNGASRLRVKQFWTLRNGRIATMVQQSKR
jgi:hypothetical protein